MKTAIVIAAILVSTLAASAQSLQDQQQCAAAAEKAKENILYYPGGRIRNYMLNENELVWAQSHFNGKLHLCIAYIIFTTWTPYQMTARLVQDAIGGHSLASYGWMDNQEDREEVVKPYDCRVEKVPYGEMTYCKTMEEFEALVQPYMVE